MAGQFGGFLCTVLFGYVVDRTGSYHTPLFLIAFMLFLAATLFFLLDPGRAISSDGADPFA